MRPRGSQLQMKKKKRKEEERKKRKRETKVKKTFQSYINFNINFEKLVFAGVAKWNFLTPKLGHFVILST